MPREVIKPGMAFYSSLVKEDIFLFAFPCLIIEGDGLFRRFNRVGGFIEHEWYRFQQDAHHLQRAAEFDLVG